MSNFILNKVTTFDDRETKWMNDDIINKIKENNNVYKTHDPIEFSQFNNSSEELVMSNEESRNKYFMNLPNKLAQLSTPIRLYWSVCGLFLYDFLPKTLVVPPVFVNEKYITEVKDKCDYFNRFFANQPS